MENLNELKQGYSYLVNDLDFDRLELELSKPNVFEILGAVNSELRHSNLLAWLLNPSESHGLYNAILKRVLREIAKDERTSFHEVAVEELDYSNVEVRREWNYIDILLLIDNYVICIENKVWSKETGDQLTRYKKVIEKNFDSGFQKIYIYLTPYGSSPGFENNLYIPLPYSVIAESIQRILQVQGESINDKTQLLLKDYLTILKRNIMQDDKTIEYAQRIYQNHKRIFDFVFMNKPDYKEPVIQLFRDLIKKNKWVIIHSPKACIRFLTPQLKEFFSSNSQQVESNTKDEFFFEFTFQSDKYLSFQVVIAPGKQSETLKSIMMQIPDATEPATKFWFSFFQNKLKLDFTKVTEMNPDELLAKVSHFFDRLEPIIGAVEKQLIANKAQFN